MKVFNDIAVGGVDKGVVVITLNRPEVKNALRTQLLGELAEALETCKTDDAVRCVVITGGAEVFAAGADIREMAELDAVGVLNDPRVGYWQQIRQFPKPIVAAVNGYCLGGGCELAMHADIIVAGSSAQFGQPEINLGIIPGAGGTQRLIRSVGKALAAKMVLTGEMIDAQTALSAGLVAEVCQPELTQERAMKLAQTIARKAPLAVRMAKESLLKSFDASLTTGLEFERRSFVTLAATEDRNEGIAAFMEKRRPVYKGK